ncbi:MAG: PEP-CTERM sorting domain-containing protein [Phycisphaerales bacterium]|nr:PEP-CTERM sorting domain-containing protein [Phycisphaerales bacterium]
MKKSVCLCVLGLAGISGVASGSIVYSGLDFSFEYAGGGDTSLAENQDRITDTVWITRNRIRGIFNIALEPTYDGFGTSGPSPLGTMWAFGTTENYESLTYTTWAVLADRNPPGLVGQNLVVYLEDEDSYMDLRFTVWGARSSVGAFSYLRSNVPAPSTGGALALGGVILMRRRR